MGVRIHIQNLHFINSGVAVVNDVINSSREGENVLPVNGSDKGAEQLVNEDASYFVSLFLGSGNSLGRLLTLTFHIVLQGLHALQSLCCLLYK